MEVSESTIINEWEGKSEENDPSVEIPEGPKEYIIAPKGEETKWYYKLENDHIVLSEFKSRNTDKNVTIYDKYIVNGNEYQTKISNNRFGAIDFNGNKYIETIKFCDNIDFSEMVSCSAMFSSCTNLLSIDLGKGFNTNKVTSIDNMFLGCSSLRSIDVSNFKFDNEYKATNVFSRCSSLTEIKGLDTLITSKCTSIQEIFGDCKSLPPEFILNIENWDVSSVTSMRNLFVNCSQIKSLDLSTWNTSNVENMEGMFKGCNNLIEIKGIDIFDTSKVSTMMNMFVNCSSIEIIDLSTFNTSNITSIERMFSGCTSLKSVNVSNFDTSGVTEMSRVFEGCALLSSLDLTSWDTSNVTSTAYMFDGCKKLEEILVSRDKWVISDTCNISLMFRTCGTDHVTYVD